MAETRFCDCPICKRTNVVGYRVVENSEKYAKIGGAGYGLLMGALLGGPLGAAVGFAAGKYGGDKFAEKLDDDFADAEFQFQCPACGHRFTKYFPK